MVLLFVLLLLLLLLLFPPLLSAATAAAALAAAAAVSVGLVDTNNCLSPPDVADVSSGILFFTRWTC